MCPCTHVHISHLTQTIFLPLLYIEIITNITISSTFIILTKSSILTSLTKNNELIKQKRYGKVDLELTLRTYIYLSKQYLRYQPLQTMTFFEENFKLSLPNFSQCFHFFLKLLKKSVSLTQKK